MIFGPRAIGAARTAARVRCAREERGAGERAGAALR